MGTQEKFEISWDLLDEVMLTHEDDTVVSSIGDAFVECMRNKAKVDIGYIAKLSGVSKDEVLQALKNVIVLNPVKFNGDIYEGYEPIDEYLSGNLHAKRKIAQERSAVFNGMFKEQISLIDSVMRCSVYFDDGRFIRAHVYRREEI